MKRLMAIFAHPDDEGVVGGTLAGYTGNGSEVTLVCATRGEMGEISDPALATPETLGAVREKELAHACSLLGIQRLIFLDYRDSGMDKTAENNDPRAFIQADEREVVGQFVGLMRRYQPDVVITFEPFGWYGHPDHIAVSRWATAAYPLAAKADVYPDSGSPWQPDALFHAILPLSKFGAMIQEATNAGYIAGSDMPADIPFVQQLDLEKRVTHVIDVNPNFRRKQEATLAHCTQFAADHMFRKIPPEMMRKATANEYFIQVSPPPATGRPAEPAGDLAMIV